MGTRTLLLQQSENKTAYASVDMSGALTIEVRWLDKNGNVYDQSAVALSPEGAQMLSKLLAIEYPAAK